MRAVARLALLMAIATVALGGDAASAGDAPGLLPINLRVSGGEDNWHADNDFRLDWDRPPNAESSSIAAVKFRVLDADGAVVIPATRMPWDATQIEHIHVPPTPGIYTADVWLVASGGERGPAVSASLRFDASRPGEARPVAPGGWIAAGAQPILRIEHPKGPIPISGLRGYAISVDRGSGSRPCAVLGRCTIAETDLGGGIDDDTTSLGILPEGSSVVRVVAVSGSGVSSTTASTTLRVDATNPEVVLAGVPTGWASDPVRLIASGRDGLSGMAASGPNGPITSISVDGGVPRIEQGPSAALTVSGEGIHRVSSFARDAAGNSGDEVPVTATVAIDERPPAVVFARAQDPAEPERIEAVVSDPMSGADATRGSIAVRPAGSHQRWRPLPTAVSAGRLLSIWDSDSYAPGSYEFKATGFDSAGNANDTTRRANGSRMILANPLKAPTRIQAGFEARRRTAKAIDYGRGARYGGRLTLASGAPLGGLPVRITALFDAGSDFSQRTSVVETTADGTFRTELPPGPSREIEVTFAGSRVLARSSSGRTRMAVAAGVRLRASRSSARVGGAPVIFSGWVGDLGAELPAAGTAVELQFRLPRRPWSEFRTVQTDARGRFRYAYSFSDDDSRGVRFQFRAYATGGDRPYEPAASKSVTVTGR
ncbi:MAG TPA: hypothetical protein VFI03_09740 [Solirubrobacterales bacterium]|nr:hypothetical protein [Solirubrobacterales bacterium]